MEHLQLANTAADNRIAVLIVAIVFMLIALSKGCQYLGIKSPLPGVFAGLAFLLVFPFKLLLKPFIDEIRIRYEEYLRERRRRIRERYRANRPP